MRWIFIFTLIFLLTNAELNVPALLKNEGEIGGAGTRARISRKGINYVATVLTQNLIPEIINARMNEEPNQMEIGADLISVAEFSMSVTQLSPLVQTDIVPPNLVTIAIPGLNLTSKLQVFGNLTGSPLSTIVLMWSEDTLVNLSVKPMRTLTGAPNLRIEACKTESIKPIKVLIDDPVVSNEQKNLIRPALEAQALNLLSDLVCARIHLIVEDRVNDRFGLLSSKIALKHIADDEIINDLSERLRSRRQKRERDDSDEFDVTAEDFGDEMSRVMRKKRQWGQIGTGMTLPFGMSMGAGLGRKKRQNWGQIGAGMNLPFGMQMGAGLGRKKRDNTIAGFDVTRANSLLLDYTIISQMNITQFGLEIESSGEVSLKGRGGTPFGPIRVPLPQNVNEDFMLQMVVSDFMPNSLMYHGHTLGIFNTRVDSNTSHLGKLMRTSCSLSTGMLFCLGSLFPTLGRKHPDRKLALLFNTVQAPVIRFRTQASGGIAFNLLGRIVFLVLEPETHQEQQVAELSIEVSAKMKLRLSSSMVRPKITLENIKLATLSPGILLQKELDDAASLSREVLQRMVNNILNEGIPIPIHPLFQLMKPKVKVMDRALLLQTNFELNERLVKQITTGNLTARV